MDSGTHDIKKIQSEVSRYLKSNYFFTKTKSPRSVKKNISTRSKFMTELLTPFKLKNSKKKYIN